MITQIGAYATPHKQSTIQAALPSPPVEAVAVSSPTSALRLSTKISKNGLSELTVMINFSWVACLAPVSSYKSKVIPTICDVNHNDPDDDRLMKMTHTTCGGYLIPDGQEVHSGGEIGNDMILLVTPYWEVCVCVYNPITESLFTYSYLIVLLHSREGMITPKRTLPLFDISISTPWICEWFHIAPVSSKRDGLRRWCTMQWINIGNMIFATQNICGGLLSIMVSRQNGMSGMKPIKTVLLRCNVTCGCFI